MPPPAFAALFGAAAPLTVGAAGAPGRLNLIGEHTDYNGGLVLPVATPQRTQVELRPRYDRQVRAWSSGGEMPAVVEYRLGGETPGRGWLDYVQGVTWALAEAGITCGGFDLRIESDLPAGAGLASSAALTVALLRGLRAAAEAAAAATATAPTKTTASTAAIVVGDGAPHSSVWHAASVTRLAALDDVALAQIARRAETGFVGVPVGIMDPLAASLARPGEALLIDCRTLAAEPLALPAGITLLAIDSGIRHRHAGGAYQDRRRECDQAAARLGVEWLCDLGSSDWPRLAALPPPLDRRARHVVSENQRVRQAAAALRAGDVCRLGELLAAAHRSLAADFEVSLPVIDRLVGLAAAEPAVAGARLSGGGFGGAVAVLFKGDRDAALAAGRRIVAAYARQTGRQGAILMPFDAD